MSATAEVGSTTNRYEMLAKLAVGGMAEIFLARASAAGVERYVVLKRVLGERAQDLEFARMFLDEARVAAQLHHPNIAQVHDIGKLGDSFFFTMEYVHGETLSDLSTRARELARAIPIGCVLTIAAGVAAGLHYAHERVGVDGTPLGIVHRDVSPSNLMITYEGTVKLVDFGVAKATHRTAETRDGTVKGKLSYMSPEQCRGYDVDRRSDLFSLGIVMWEMLTGERLFKKTANYDRMEAIVFGPTPAASDLRVDVPPELDSIVTKLLSKSPVDRFQTADELVEALEAVAVRTSSVLSTTSLGRFVRELFGRRREPWIEIRAVVNRDDIVTVTTEPVPAELAIPLPDATSNQLAKLPDLSARTGDVSLHNIAAPSKATGGAIAPTRSWSYAELAAPTFRRRRRVWLISGGAAIAVAITIAIVMAFTRDTETSSPHVAQHVPPVVDAELPIEAVVTMPEADAGVRTDPVPAFNARRYADVAAACASNASVLADNASLCVLAACRLHDVAKAQHWLRNVATPKRASVVHSCEAWGTVLESSVPRLKPDAGLRPSVRPDAPKPDCNVDPLACQF